MCGMTECKDGHEWEIKQFGRHGTIVECGCGQEMTSKEAEAILNEHAALKKRAQDLEGLLDVERLASLIHDEWISWSKTLAEKKEVTPEKAKAWEKYWIPYSKLSEEVKDMDREWAYKVALKEGSG